MLTCKNSLFLINKYFINSSVLNSNIANIYECNQHEQQFFGGPNSFWEYKEVLRPKNLRTANLHSLGNMISKLEYQHKSWHKFFKTSIHPKINIRKVTRRTDNLGESTQHTKTSGIHIWRALSITKEKINTLQNGNEDLKTNGKKDNT